MNPLSSNKIGVIPIFTILLGSLIIISSQSSPAFAATYGINIPAGVSVPECEKTNSCFYPYEQTIDAGDEIIWFNDDSAAHTVTSGNPTDGPDGTFDSSLFGPGKLFSHKFVKSGTYDYFCSIHLWMTGKVNVVGVETMKVMHNVGADAGDGKSTFDVEYLLEKTLVSVAVDQKEKAVTFSMAGKGNDGDLFVIKLPKNLISGDFSVWVDNQPTIDFEEKEDGGINTLTIPLTAKSETVTILGSTIVPEFGPIAVLIFAIAIISIIAASTKHPNLFQIRRS